MYHMINNIPVFGTHDDNTIEQMIGYARHPRAVAASLQADGHFGYVAPVGSVLALDNAVSLEGIGVDIGCGNKAVATDLRADDIRADLARIMDTLAATIEFGLGSGRGIAVDHPIFDDPRWNSAELLPLRARARTQLGSVGGGNHFCDVFSDELGRVWVGVHFGSRGFGHKVATGFINLAHGRSWQDKPLTTTESTVLALDTALGAAYWDALQLAQGYAYAGRNVVVQQVLDVLGAQATETVHNHHNAAWIETHGGREVVVVRKGATPAWPGQKGFIGGSMGDCSVIIEGVDSATSAAALHSTVHGAGRVMSRTKATGRSKWGKTKGEPGVKRADMDVWLAREGVLLRGGDVDESPQVYRRLNDVLAAQGDSIRVVHTLRPLGVVMAGADVIDSFKD